MKLNLLLCILYLACCLCIVYGQETPTEAPTEAPTTEAPTTEAPTTEAPTTEAPTTEAPTTKAPTTEAPTTEAPTTKAPAETPTETPANTPRVNTPAPRTPSPNKDSEGDFAGNTSKKKLETWKVGAIAGGIGFVFILIMIALCCRRRSDDMDMDSPLPSYAIGAPAPVNRPVQSTAPAYRPTSQTSKNNSASLGDYYQVHRGEKPADTSEAKRTIAQLRKQSTASLRNTSTSSSTERKSSMDSSRVSDVPSRTSSVKRSSSRGNPDARKEWLNAVANGNMDAGDDSRVSAMNALGKRGTTNWHTAGSPKFSDIDRESYEL